jgi:hypothetical protein
MVSADRNPGRGRHGLPATARQRLLFRWSVVLVALTAMIILGFMMFWLRAQRNAGTRSMAKPVPAQVRISSQFVSPGEDEAADIVRSAMGTRDPGLVQNRIRPGDAAPSEVVAFMAATEERDGGIGQLLWLGGLDVEGMQVEGVLVEFTGRTPPVHRLALLVPDEVGVWKLDFEAFARWSRPSWGDLLEKRAERARVRVLVARDNYYNGPFMDENQWLNFALAAPELQGLLPDGIETLSGYCRKESAQAKALERIFEQGDRTRRVTLEIRRNDEAGDRQFEITRVLAADWLMPPTAFDERFN